MLEPGTGALGSIGEHGIGRLPEPPELLAAVEAAITSRDLDGLQRPRHRRRDARADRRRPLRRQPLAPAAWASRSPPRPRAAGRDVTVVAANVSLPQPHGVDVVAVETAAELHDACLAAFDRADVLLMAAAVADYRPSRAARGQDQEGRAGRRPGIIGLEQTADVLAALSERRRDGQLLVGFAAEHGDGAVAYGRGKLERKRLDAVVVNDIGRPGIGFDAPDNEVTIVTARRRPGGSEGLEGRGRTRHP